MANVISNTFKGMLLKGQMTLSDSYKIILMQDGFIFDNAGDASSNEIIDIRLLLSTI